MAEQNPYRQKLTDAQRARVVDEVRRGVQIQRVAEKYGVQSASVWNLVYKAAFRELVMEAGHPGMKPQEYLRHHASSRNSNGPPSTEASADSESRGMNAGAITEAARAAASALERLAEATGGMLSTA